MNKKQHIYTVQNVKKEYKLHGGYFADQQEKVLALKDITFTVPQQCIFGIVGQSGSGKSTLMRLLIGLEAPSQGNITFYDELQDTSIELTQLTKKQLCYYQSKVKIVFQDPARSLNHRLSIEHILLDSLYYTPHFTQQCKDEQLSTKKAKKQLALEIIHSNLKIVGLEALHKQSMLQRYPSDFSGGQRQRIAIARALIHNPAVLICDEVTSSLDAETRKNVANMLVTLNHTKRITLLFITHDLSLVNYLCDTIMVMKQGSIVDIAGYKNILAGTISNDTQELLDALPKSIKAQHTIDNTTSYS